MLSFWKKLQMVILASALAVCVGGCATTHGYDGPVGDHPAVDVVHLRSIHASAGGPIVTTMTTLKVSNPSLERVMDVTVDCSPSTQPRFDHAVASGGTYATFKIQPRTTQDLLLAPDDGDCTVTER